MPEIADFATIVLLVAGGLALALLSARLSELVSVPAPAVFLVVASVAAQLWSTIGEQLSIREVERVAVVALIVILFNGGVDIGWQRFRASAGPIIVLGVVGTFVTAGIVMGVAHYALGFSWILAGITGAALAPTDPAVMFSVLGGHELEGRSRTTLEGEAGVNDPAGIALMIGMIELATHPHASAAVVVREFAVEMGVGCALGAVGGLLLAAVLQRFERSSGSLQPLLGLLLAGVLYGGTALVGGSGFMAVFLAGLIVGGSRQRSTEEIVRFTGPLASLAEVTTFVTLGLTVTLGTLSGRTWVEGVVLIVTLAVLARPVMVVLAIGRARFSWRERAFIGWSGLKGAVPILLAAFAVMSGVQGAGRIYDVVFVVVLLSVVCQGTLVAPVARKLGLLDRPAAR